MKQQNNKEIKKLNNKIDELLKTIYKERGLRKKSEEKLMRKFTKEIKELVVIYEDYFDKIKKDLEEAEKRINKN